MDAQVDINPDAIDAVVHPESLTNEDPSVFYQGVQLIQQYGWFILLGVLLFLYLKSKLQPALEKMRRKIKDDRDTRNYDSVKAHAQVEGMEISRRRMQEKLDAQAARHAEQMKIKEEEKRQHKIDDWDGHQQGKGYRSKFKPKEKEDEAKPTVKPKSKPLRQADYSPLSGGGSSDSCAWRPAQRGGGGGGG